MNVGEEKVRRAMNVGYQSQDNQIAGLYPQVMTQVYEKQFNLITLQRSLSKEIDAYCQALLESNSYINLRYVIDPEKSQGVLDTSLPDFKGRTAFIEDLVLLLDMYACLFNLEEVGFRLQVLDRAMCPRFHTDKLGCRLVSTYKGKGTQWLYNSDVDRSKLGTGNMGLSDDKSGVFSHPNCIQSVLQGDVVLLKGDGWYDNEGLGIVHRSPPVSQGEQRIVVTMDFA